jgi:hypothetical protein
MKARNLLLLAAALVTGLTAAGASYARGGHRGGFHHGGARVGVFIGAPVFAYGYGYRPYYPYYYPPAYYPYAVPAPVIVQPATPPVYIERSDEQAATPSADYWFYCPDTKSYYPYVGTCASPWQRVAPQTPQS